MSRSWLVPVVAALAVLAPGAIYAYSLFAEPLIAAFGWKISQVNWAFALALFFVGVGAVIGGIAIDRIGARWVAGYGALLWGAGNILTGVLAPRGLLYLMLGYGVVGGLGVGMVYLSALVIAVRAMPARRGLAAGLVTMGMAAGAVIYEAAVKSAPGYEPIANAASVYLDQQSQALAARAAFNSSAFALQAGQVEALRSLFSASGIAFVVIGAFFALLLRVRKASETADPALDYSPGAMLLMPQFYILWVMLFLNVIAGIIIIGNGVPLMHELSGQPAAVVMPWFLLAGVLSAAGALLWGAISDRYGRKIPYALLFVVEAVAFFLSGHTNELRPIALAMGIILFCYSGGFAIAIAALADIFGTRWLGPNLGILLTAWGSAGLAGTWFATSVKELTGSFASTVEPAALLLLIAVIFPLVLEPKPLPEIAPSEHIPTS
jgi:MFS family permease